MGARRGRSLFASPWPPDHLYGLALVWSAPLPGLRLSATFQASHSNFSSDVTYSGTFGPASVSIPTHTETVHDVPNVCVGSVEYARAGLKLAAEYYRSTNDISSRITGLPGPPLTTKSGDHAEAWYVQASYRFNDHFQAQTYYSAYWPTREDKDGTRYARQNLQYRAWSKDFAVTGRVDINRFWLLKLEYHHIDGTANVSPSENPNGIDGNWDMFVAKTTFYF